MQRVMVSDSEWQAGNFGVFSSLVGIRGHSLLQLHVFIISYHSFSLTIMHCHSWSQVLTHGNTWSRMIMHDWYHFHCFLSYLSRLPIHTNHHGVHHMGIIHIDSIVHGAHLLPRFLLDAPIYHEINYMNAFCSMSINSLTITCSKSLFDILLSRVWHTFLMYFYYTFEIPLFWNSIPCVINKSWRKTELAGCE